MYFSIFPVILSFTNLPDFVMTISVPKEWNWSHKWQPSSATLASFAIFNIFNIFLIYSMIYVPQVATLRCHACILCNFHVHIFNIFLRYSIYLLIYSMIYAPTSGTPPVPRFRPTQCSIKIKICTKNEGS